MSCCGGGDAFASDNKPRASCCQQQGQGQSQGEAVREVVKEYYGKTLHSTADLKTAACYAKPRPMPANIAQAVAGVSEEVSSRYYGCGLTIPALLEGLTVLDLGCGAGRDCFVISKLVGPAGHVHGVDMTDEQLEVARRNVEWHTRKYGYERPNVEFHKGYIEDLAMIASGSVDLVVSNCVVNLSADKPAVLREAHRVLREGGEMYFSDVYADRRVPPEVAGDPLLYGECLGGALYWNDFLRLARGAGFADPRLVEDHGIQVPGRLGELLRGTRFWSATYRLWKLEGLESDCEDYGQAVVYRGTVPESPAELRLDAHHTMPAGKVFPVCGNTYRMLHGTRFAKHFDFVGDGKRHYGVFADCGKNVPFSTAEAAPVCSPASCSGSKSCCC
eukprot:m51a1_g1682 putative methyltransferase type 11 (389) ;mRNA; r:436210-437859